MPDSGSVRLDLYLDPTDGTAELTVSAGRAGYAGRASAWFHADQIAAFADALAAFPLPAAGTEPLVGGYWGSPGGVSRVAEEHVRLRARPADRRGTVALEVRLAESDRDADARAGPQRAAVEVLTEYEPLRGFAAEVARLARGQVARAQLGPDLPGWP